MLRGQVRSHITVTVSVVRRCKKSNLGRPLAGRTLGMVRTEMARADRTCTVGSDVRYHVAY